MRASGALFGCCLAACLLASRSSLEIIGVTALELSELTTEGEPEVPSPGPRAAPQRVEQGSKRLNQRPAEGRAPTDGLSTATLQAHPPQQTSQQKQPVVPKTEDPLAIKARKIAADEVERVRSEDKEDVERQESSRAAIDKAKYSPEVMKVASAADAQTQALQTQMEDIQREGDRTSDSLESKSRKAVMALYHQEAQKLLHQGDGPEENPITDEMNDMAISSWLTADPLLSINSPVRRLTMLDEAVDEAERKASSASDKEAQVYKAVAERIKDVSVSKMGTQLEELQSTGSLLVQKKARCAMRLVVFQAYNDGFGKDGNAYRRAYLCQKAVKAALDTIGLAQPTPKQRTHLCHKRLFQAESKMRVEAAVGAALVVAQKGFKSSEQCTNAKETGQQMRIAQIEVAAVKKACPDMNVDTQGPSKRALRAKIRAAISQHMSKSLRMEVPSEKEDPVRKEMAKLLGEAHQAWEDVHHFSMGSPVPKGLVITPHASDASEPESKKPRKAAKVQVRRHGKTTVVEKRVADDGKQYTKAEFVKFFGRNGKKEWDEHGGKIGLTLKTSARPVH